MKVFLSYPSEHLKAAREVKNFVNSVGIECWFDKDSLVAGEDWDRARSEALRGASLVVLLCASQTNDRNGVYQRELNEALRLQDDRRMGTIYIIPFRIEDVALPSELARQQYVDYSDTHWRRLLAASLMRGVMEAGEQPPLQLQVAAAQPDEGNRIPRAITEENIEGTIQIEWIRYALSGDYWEFINGLIDSRALGALYDARRWFSEWWKPGSDYYLGVSEHHRKGQLVSLTIANSSYFAGAAHPNHGIETINVFGERAGIMKASDLFDSSPDAFSFLNDYVNLDLRRQSGSEPMLNLSSYMEQYGWNFYDQFNFNESGMTLNFSSSSGLPHVLGAPQVYVPWQSVSEFLAPVARRILLDEVKS